MKIRIIAPLHLTHPEFDIQCGDYWVKKDLEDEFTRRGYKVVGENSDVDFYLFGRYIYGSYLTAPRRFCWVYSHPNVILRDNKWKKFSKQFEHIFVLSNKFLSKVGNNSSVLLGASSKEFISRKKDPEYDLVFVGNAKKPARVELMKYLIKLDKYNICLVGLGWDIKLGDQIKKIDYRGSYVENNKLGKFFNLGALSFYSAHEDMRIWGFVPVRILDIFRSSENLCISDDNYGLKDIFRNIPIYKNKEELSEYIDYFLKYPNKREEVALKCREDSKQWTFDRTVTEFEKWL